MSKIRADYENSWWPRFKRWLDGEVTDTEYAREERLTGEELRAMHEVGIEKHIINKKQNREQFDKHYEEWAQTSGVKYFKRMYQIAAVLICAVIITSLLITVSYLPQFGEANNPVNNEVSARYIEKGLQETGAVNIVTGMILDYRAFIPLGSLMCCLLLLFVS